MPWKVTVGEESWESYSVEIGSVLSSLAPAISREHFSMDVESYWSNHFWNHPGVWDEETLRELSLSPVQRMIKRLVNGHMLFRYLGLRASEIGTVHSQPDFLGKHFDVEQATRRHA